MVKKFSIFEKACFRNLFKKLRFHFVIVYIINARKKEKEKESNTSLNLSFLSFRNGSIPKKINFLLVIVIC